MLVEDVAHLMEDFGSTLTFVRQTGQTYSPSTGVLSAGTATSFSARGVFVNYRDDRVDGSVVRMGDRMLLVSARDAGDAPEVGDRVDGVQIINVRTIAPSGTIIAWTCQTRR